MAGNESCKLQIMRVFANNAYLESVTRHCCLLRSEYCVHLVKFLVILSVGTIYGQATLPVNIKT
jgi:hypothetical protein